MEAHAGPQGELPGELVDRAPRFRQARHGAEMLVLEHERLVDVQLHVAVG
jgi:hypothetical protein